MKIQSNLSDAQKYATSIQNRSQELSLINQTQQDEQTTVAGNGKAHESFGYSKSARDGISTALSDMVKNLHSVAKEFEALDQCLANEVKK